MSLPQFPPEHTRSCFLVPSLAVVPGWVSRAWYSSSKPRCEMQQLKRVVQSALENECRKHCRLGKVICNLRKVHGQKKLNSWPLGRVLEDSLKTSPQPLVAKPRPHS